MKFRALDAPIHPQRLAPRSSGLCRRLELIEERQVDVVAWIRIEVLQILWRIQYVRRPTHFHDVVRLRWQLQVPQEPRRLRARRDHRQQLEPVAARACQNVNTKRYLESL